MRPPTRTPKKRTVALSETTYRALRELAKVHGWELGETVARALMAAHPSLFEKPGAATLTLAGAGRLAWTTVIDGSNAHALSRLERALADTDTEEP